MMAGESHCRGGISHKRDNKAVMNLDVKQLVDLLNEVVDHLGNLSNGNNDYSLVPTSCMVSGVCL